MDSYITPTKNKARSLKNTLSASDGEKILWSHLSHKQVLNTPFNRQKPILHFIVDFYCAQAKLVIEVASSPHFDTHHMLRDNIRDNKISELGLQVLRFNNRQVVQETRAVTDIIYRTVKERLKKYTP